MSDTDYEDLAEEESPLSSYQLQQLRDWPVWQNHILMDTQYTFLDFFESGENCQSFQIEEAYERLFIHELAPELGLRTKSTGPRGNRRIHIWKPEGYSFFLPNADEVLDAHEERQNERKKTHQMKDAEEDVCPDCGRNGSEVPIGMRIRDCGVQCLECNEKDEYWSAFKWEPVDENYMYWYVSPR